MHSINVYDLLFTLFHSFIFITINFPNYNKTHKTSSILQGREIPDRDEVSLGKFTNHLIIPIHTGSCGVENGVYYFSSKNYEYYSYIICFTPHIFYHFEKCIMPSSYVSVNGIF